MTPNTGRLLAADELPNHQIVGSFATVEHSGSVMQFHDRGEAALANVGLEPKSVDLACRSAARRGVARRRLR